MGYSKPLQRATLERLAYWWLFRRTIDVSMDQLVDMAEVMIKPVRVYDPGKSNELYTLRQYIRQELEKRQKKNAGHSGSV